jgi:hypothetical protein
VFLVAKSNAQKPSVNYGLATLYHNGMFYSIAQAFSMPNLQRNIVLRGIDTNAVVQFQRIYGGTDENLINKIYLVNENGQDFLILCGYTQSYQSLPVDVYRIFDGRSFVQAGKLIK